MPDPRLENDPLKSHWDCHNVNPEKLATIEATAQALGQLAELLETFHPNSIEVRDFVAQHILLPDFCRLATEALGTQMIEAVDPSPPLSSEPLVRKVAQQIVSWTASLAGAVVFMLLVGASIHLSVQSHTLREERDSARNRPKDAPIFKYVVAASKPKVLFWLSFSSSTRAGMTQIN